MNTPIRIVALLMCLTAPGVGCSGSSEPAQNPSDENNSVADMGDVGENQNNVNNVNNVNNINNQNNVNNVNNTSTNNGVEDMGGDMPAGFGRTISDYRRCQTDADCPVGLGTCVTEVPLNRPDADGSDRVALNEVFGDLADGEGVCSAVCTVNETACDSLTVNGNTPDAEPYVCQLIAVGTSPYPDAPPAFPFDGTLEREELNDGVPFGAICRPPFQLDDEVDRGFCAACVGGDDACAGTAECWDFLTEQPAAAGEAGECLGRCAGDCPLGFSCTTLGDADYCVPDQKTCTACLDRDGDGRGTGRCGDDANPVTPVDCDDLNENVYFDASDENHPFPTFCAPENDYNCNGLSDADEQIGTSLFGAEHCTSCGDTCAGALPDGEWACVQGACVASCDMGFATCDDDDTNGCETAVTNPDLIYFADLDEDGRGDPNATQFACDPNTPPMGYVADDSDCDDTNPNTYGAGPAGAAAPEICDGEDNDCDMVTDEDLTPPAATCTAAAQGACAEGTYTCTTMWECEASAPGVETCNGVDDDCDGSADLSSGTAPSEAPTWFPDCDGDGQGDDSATGVKLCNAPTSPPAQCAGGTWASNDDDCNDQVASIRSGIQENCNTAADDNCNGVANSDDDPSLWSNAVLYYADFDGDTYSPSPNVRELGCGAPPQTGWTQAINSQVDCNDTKLTVNPAASEDCNTTDDDDCDGNFHNATTGTIRYYRDVDGDGAGPNSTGRSFCFNSMTASERATYSTTTGGDCNDSTATRSVPSNGHQYTGADQTPGRQEVCEGYDGDCDGVIDDGCPSSFSIANLRSLNQTAGTGSGWTYYDCPAGEVMSGIRVHGKIPLGFCSGSTGVFGVRPVCSKPVINAATANDPISYSSSNTSIGQGPLMGQSPSPDGGCGWDTIKDNTFQCSSGASMRGIYGRSGSRIDRLGAICIARTLNYSFTPASMSLITEGTTATGPSGWNGGGDFSRRCANNEVVKGIWVAYSGGRATAIDLRCADINLVNK